MSLDNGTYQVRVPSGLVVTLQYGEDQGRLAERKRLLAVLKPLEERAMAREISRAGRRPPADLMRAMIAFAEYDQGLEPGSILGRRRTRPIVRGRWSVILRLRVLGYSLPSIGSALGVDHTTVMHALKTIEPWAVG